MKTKLAMLSLATGAVIGGVALAASGSRLH